MGLGETLVGELLHFRLILVCMEIICATYLRLLLQMSREKRRMWRNLSGSLLSATTWDPQRCAHFLSCYLMLASCVFVASSIIIYST
jgi:hypothetical protein